MLGFLDDFSLDGHQNQVARDVQQIIEFGVRMGLSLNVNKCEVIADPANTIMDMLLQSFERIAALFRGPNLDNAWAGRRADLSRTVKTQLDQFTGRPVSSKSLIRVHHLHRFSPSVDKAGLATFDELLRTALCRIAT